MSVSNVLQQSLSDAAAAVERRDLSPVELVRASLEAIERQNANLNAFRLVLDERAVELAQQAEDEIAAGRYHGPLHGIPVAVKDLMDMKGTTTQAGSRVLADRTPDDDSETVRRLERAGAIIVGKTHMPEFAYSPASNNEHYGPVRNPWKLDRDTGGSSSGSGAALAGGMVFGATGSDTGGSIRIPAAMCGLVGLKPTFGRVSARGAVSLAWSLDHVGPMARTVRDAAIMLDAMAGYDPGDPRTRDVPAGGYAADLESGVTGLRIGSITEDRDGDLGTPGVLRGCADGLSALRDAGAAISDLALPELSDLQTMNGTVLNIEAAAYYEQFLRDRPDEIGSWTWDRLLAAYAYSPTDYVRLAQVRAKLRDRMDGLLQQYDLLALPSVSHEAPEPGGVQQNARLTGAFNLLGWPAVSVPAGLGADDLPVSLQLVAHPWRERTLLRAARIVERDGPWQGRLSPLLA